MNDVTLCKKGLHFFLWIIIVDATITKVDTRK